MHPRAGENLRERQRRDPVGMGSDDPNIATMPLTDPAPPSGALVSVWTSSWIAGVSNGRWYFRAALDREAELAGRLVLGHVQAHEPRERLALVEPERRSQVGEIQRARCRYDGHGPPAAKVEGEVAQSKVIEIPREPIDRVLEIGGRQVSRARQMYERSLGFESQEGARKQTSAVQLSCQPLPSNLAEQQT